MTLYPQLDELLELRHQARALGLASNHLVNTAFAGLFASVFRGTGIHFEEVREYQEGDDIRNMDWKVTARANKPYLKLYREERERNVILLVDKGPHMNFGTRGTFKSVQAARAAALIGWASSQQQDRVGGMTFGDASLGMQYFRPAKGRRALWRLLHRLTQPPTSARTLPDCLQQALRKATAGAPTGSLVFIIGDFNRSLAELDSVLGGLMQRVSVVVVPVDDPADREIPEMGKVTFRAPDGGLLEVDTDNGRARSQYREAWEQRRQELRVLTSRLGAFLLPVSTTEDIHFALYRALEQRARVRTL